MDAHERNEELWSVIGCSCRLSRLTIPFDFGMSQFFYRPRHTNKGCPSNVSCSGLNHYQDYEKDPKLE